MVDGLIYVIGGANCDSFEVYDPQSNKWTLSKQKLLSKKHDITNAVFLNPATNIIQGNLFDFYKNE